MWNDVYEEVSCYASQPLDFSSSDCGPLSISPPLSPLPTTNIQRAPARIQMVSYRGQHDYWVVIIIVEICGVLDLYKTIQRTA